jgi:thiamine-phosphate pyrophosphorylase
VSRPARFPQTPILCYVTDRSSLPLRPSADDRGGLLECIVASASAGVDWIQIREKDLPAREIASVVRDSLAVVKESRLRSASAPRILVNDRMDVAFTERAGGVHLGENSLPVHDVSKWIHALEKSAPRDFLMGVSCHSLESAMATARDGADYIFFGPVFSTPSKAAFGAPQGLQRLKEVCSAVTLPVLAIGGITLENASACLEAGAAGIAAIRLFQDAIDLPVVVNQLHNAQR